MKLRFAICTFLFSLFFSNPSFAKETPLHLGTAKARIHGLLDVKAKADVLAFYVPAGTLDPSKSLLNCKFPEDQSSPNDAGKFAKIAVVQGNGNYDLKVPLTGLRGTCEYILDTVYLDFENDKILQTLALLTKASVDSMNKGLIADGMEPMEVPLLGNLQKIFCEFNTKEPVGLCQTSEGFLPELNYQISNSAEDYVLDVQAVEHFK